MTNLAQEFRDGCKMGHHGRLFPAGTPMVATALSSVVWPRILPSKPNGGFIHRFKPDLTCSKAYVPADPGAGKRLQKFSKSAFCAEAKESRSWGPHS